MIDTGPMVALFSEDDEHREHCADALDSLRPPLFTCWPVVTEAAWLLRRWPGGIRRVFEGFHDGFFALLPLDAADLIPIAAIMRRYEDAGLQFADAALAHLAER